MATTELDTTKARIIEAAGAVFAQKGFENSTIREICQSAQANIAAVNYYFGDKQRLYVEAVKQAHRSRAEAAPLPKWEPGTPAEVKLTDFIRTLLMRMLFDSSGSWHGQLMLREVSRPHSACEELVKDYIRPHFELLQGILNELLPAEVPATTRRLIAFGIVGQCLYYRVAQPVVERLISAEEYATYTPAMLAHHITHSTLASIGLQPAICQPGAAS